MGRRRGRLMRSRQRSILARRLLNRDRLDRQQGRLPLLLECNPKAVAGLFTRAEFTDKGKKLSGKELLEFIWDEKKQSDGGGFVIMFFVIGLVASLLIGWGLFPKLLYSVIVAFLIVLTPEHLVGFGQLL